MVHALVIAAFAESAGFEHPSSALHESVQDVERATGAALALLGDRPVGSVRFEVTADALRFRRLVVHPAARGSGIGSAIVDWLEAHARSLGLSEIRADARSVQPDNRPYYLARGYEVLGYSDCYGVRDLSTHLRKLL